MLILLFFVSALAAARAECDACIKGFCHDQKILIEGSQITDQIAIDRTENILYVQLDHRTTAVFLDEAKIRTVHNENTKGLAVDQQTQVLYSSLNGIVYAHTYQQGRYNTDQAFALDRRTTPAKLRYEDTLYIINEDGSSAYFSKISETFTGYDNLEHFPITDMVNVQNITHWYFVSDDKLYKFIYDGTMKWHLISDKKHVLSIGKNGDVYFGEASEKVIYKLDRETGELEEYANYADGSLEDFVFDRDENIVFLDADGRVKQWVPSGQECFGPHNVRSQGAMQTTYEAVTFGQFYQNKGNNNIVRTYAPPIEDKSNESHEMRDEANVYTYYFNENGEIRIKN